MDAQIVQAVQQAMAAVEEKQGDDGQQPDRR
jgi:hypothetical protein